MGLAKGIRRVKAWDRECAQLAFDRFRKFCRFEPETGCVVWTGGITKGRGHHIDYPAFWYDNRRWFGHRWSAKFIHGLEIDGLQVDHWCPNIPLPNTLCVEHVQPLSSEKNRHLQTERRRHYVHLQVGLTSYEEVYGPMPQFDPEVAIPFFTAPAWLGNAGAPRGHECPF